MEVGARLAVERRPRWESRTVDANRACDAAASSQPPKARSSPSPKDQKSMGSSPNPSVMTQSETGPSSRRFLLTFARQRFADGLTQSSAKLSLPTITPRRRVPPRQRARVSRRQRNCLARPAALSVPSWRRRSDSRFREGSSGWSSLPSNDCGLLPRLRRAFLVVPDAVAVQLRAIGSGESFHPSQPPRHHFCWCPIPSARLRRASSGVANGHQSACSHAMAAAPNTRAFQLRSRRHQSTGSRLRVGGRWNNGRASIRSGARARHSASAQLDAARRRPHHQARTARVRARIVACEC